MSQAANTPAPGQQRQVWIDVLRGVAVVGVVLYHVCLWVFAPMWAELDVPSTYWWRHVTGPLLDFSMPVLTALSGLLCARAVTGGVRAPAVLRKAVNAGYLYLVWTLIYFVLQTLTSRSRWAMRIDGWEGLALEVIRPTTILWYLWALAIWTLAFAWLRRVPTGVIIPALAAVAVAWQLAFPKAGVDAKVITHAVYFAMGVRGRDLAARWVTSPRPGRLTGWLAVAAASWAGTRLHLAVLPTLAYSACGMANVAWAAAVAGYVRCLPRWLAATWAWMGRRSLEIYVMSLPAIEVVVNLVFRVAPQWCVQIVAHPWGQAVMPLAVCAVVVAATLALGWALRALHATWLLRPPRCLREARLFGQESRAPTQ